MSAGSRRKQNKPQKVGNPPLITPETNGKDEIDTTVVDTPASLDSHVCGLCCAQFFSLEDFLAHKGSCSGEWPALGSKSLPTSSSTAASSEKSMDASDRLSSDDSAVDLSVKRSTEQERNKEDESAESADDSGDVSKLKTVIHSLQQQQIMQLKLIKRICSRVIPDSSPSDCLPSNFISPPDSNGTEDSVDKDTANQLRDEHLCEICQEIFCSRGSLLWHTMHAHSSLRPFRCDICCQRFSNRRKIRSHIEEHKYANWLQRSRARSLSPVDFFGKVPERSGRDSVPLFSDTEEALTSIVNEKSQSSDDGSPDDDEMNSYSDISQASSPTPQTESLRPLDLSFIPVSSVNGVEFPKNGVAGLFPNVLNNNNGEKEEDKNKNGPNLFGSFGNNGCFSLMGGTFPSAPLAVPTIHGTNGQPPATMYSPVKDDDDWESMMEVCQTDEAEKIRELVGDKPQAPVTDPNQCLICRRILSCKSALQMHYRTHTGQRPFKCKICLRAFTTKGNLKTHMGVHRSKHPFRMHHQCPICQKRFLNAVLLQQHIRLHTNQLRSSSAVNQNVPPPRPAEKNADRPLATQEIKAEPPPVLSRSQPIASVPLISPTSTFSIASGLRLPLVPQPYPFSPVMLPVSQQQLSMMSGRPGTTCNICYKVFACNSALEIHYRSHTKERPFKCDACGRGFSTKGNMKQHLLTHKIRDMPQRSDSRSDTQSTTPSESETKPVFIQQSLRRSESSMGKFSEEKPRQLDLKREVSMPEMVKKEPEVMPERSERKLLLSQDSESSDGPDPSPLESIQRMWAQTEPPPPRKPPILSKHQCGVCFKHFSSSSALQIHMRTHTGDKPFKCTVCNRAFTTKGNLKVHMGTHMWHNPSRRGRRIFDIPVSPGSQGMPGEYPQSPTNGESSQDGDGDQSSPPLLETEISAENYNRSTTPPPTEATKSSFYNGRDSQQNGTTSALGSGSIQKILGSGFPPLFPNIPFPPNCTLPSVSLPIPSPFLSGRKSLTGPDATFGSCSSAAQNFHLFPPPPSMSRFQEASRGSSGSSSAGGLGRGDPVDAMMWMWRNVCSVCQRVCSSPTELEEHLKLHLNGTRSAAAV